jgi:hypothetical protein
VNKNNKHQISKQLWTRALTTTMIGRGLIKEATDLLPKLSLTDNLSEINAFIKDNLKFNSLTSRSQCQRYISAYLFPDGVVDLSLLSFSRKATSASLKNVCFYKFCKRYPLTYDLYNELITPNITRGNISRKKILTYLKERFPDSGAVKHQTFFFLEAAKSADIVSYKSGILSYAYRHVDPISFAYILHNEFPNPGMYDIGLIENNQAFVPQLWLRNELLETLYVLRNMKILSKISEIDSVRQFTTFFSLEEFIAKF